VRLALAAIAWLAALAIAERIRPLRPPTVPVRARLRANLTLTALAGATSAATASAAAHALARRYRGGLSRRAPAPLQAVVAFVLLDAAFYFWHRANHEVPALWRLHAVHHLDPDLDLSTAFRFHPGEILLSTGFRVLQMLLVGPTPAVLRAHDAVFVAAVAFHHANARVPGDAALSWLIVTPTFHGVHHDVRHLRTNYATIFSVWDPL
jgi:sterol desaturase/sphingolipid hydroxylase (fatty acid hydroxylase superfamily)